MAFGRLIKKSTLKTINIVIFMVFLVFLIPVSGLAQSPKIAITPLVFEFFSEPGESSEGIIRVGNHSENTSARIIIEIEDMFPEGEEGRVRLEVPQEERRTFSLSHWIETEPSEFVLGPGEEQRVEFIINVPEDAEPGGYYVSVVAGTHGITPEGTGVAVRTRIGALILMAVSGETEEKLEVVSFDVPSYSERGPIEFVARFENKGTIHVRPDASIVVTNILGRKVAEIPLESRNVLPGAVRRIEAEWDTGLLWGKYTATLSGTYGMANLPLNPVSVTFWGFPWKIALGALIVLLLLGLTRKRWMVALRILIKGEAGHPR